jgi:quercetin dioxygenase-like cupin family protein
MRTISSGGVTLAKLIKPEDVKSGLTFFSEDSDYLQVGTWEYEAGKELLAHTHNRVERAVERTHEAIAVMNGSLEATIYTLEGNEVEKIVLEKGDVLILLESGHGYKVLEDNTRVLEVKNGPYLGAEVDRRGI